MLGQATAVLVSFSTFIATEFDAIALPALFGERLAIAGASNPCTLKPTFPFVGRHIIGIVIDGALLSFQLWMHCESVGWQAGGW
jgi:hypothetical protein